MVVSKDASTKLTAMWNIMTFFLLMVAILNCLFPYVSSQHHSSENNIKDASLWESIQMPEISYFAGISLQIYRHVSLSSISPVSLTLLIGLHAARTTPKQQQLDGVT